MPRYLPRCRTAGLAASLAASLLVNMASGSATGPGLGIFVGFTVICCERYHGVPLVVSFTVGLAMTCCGRWRVALDVELAPLL